MFRNFSIEELALIAILLEEETQCQGKQDETECQDFQDEPVCQYEQYETEFQGEEDETVCQGKQDEIECHDKRDETGCQNKQDETECQNKHDETECQNKQDETECENKQDETECQNKQDETVCQNKQDETVCQNKQDETECENKQDETECQNKQDETECQNKQDETGCQDRQDETVCQENKKRRFAVHPNNKKRKTEGEFFTLFKELMDDEDRFLKYFRMSQNEFEIILSIIKPVIRKQNTVFKESITPREKLAVCLRFLATGDSYMSISQSYRLGVSTVHNIITEVCTAILQEMTKECMPTPTKEDWSKQSEEFWNVWSFPNCIGALGGKHITVTSPLKGGSLNLNNKKTCSIVIMAIVDINYRFICVDVGAYGDISDGGVFSNSNFGKALEANAFNAPEEKYLPGTEILMPHIIVGDEAFPLKTYLMRPYPQSQVHDPCKNKFNDRLSRARKVAENAFEQLAQKFRFYKRRIHLKPENAHKIVMTTCVLHNFVKYNHVHAEECANDHNLKVLPRQNGKWKNAAIDVRDKFATFFNSPAGAM